MDVAVAGVIEAAANAVFWADKTNHYVWMADLLLKPLKEAAQKTAEAPNF